MSEKNLDGSWYCRNCGYLHPSHVTFIETCDECHMPVRWHDDNEQTALERATDRIKELEAQVRTLDLNLGISMKEVDRLQAQVAELLGKVITIKSCYENESLEHEKTILQAKKLKAALQRDKE